MTSEQSLQLEAHLQRTENGGLSLSLYDDNPAADKDFSKAIARLNLAFPNAFNTAEERNGFYALLIEVFKRENFTAKHVEDAVFNAIKTCGTYRYICIADIVKFDKKVKLYTYGGYCDLISSGLAAHEDFGKRQIDDRTYWFLKKDLEQ
ncbi:MAG: hypothetical protein LBJ63_07650 [Prevotellaceae bacterium]|jgi:hypothetical protein|nr:hypothetical protein [Prevotellaceae bacterium]